MTSARVRLSDSAREAEDRVVVTGIAGIQAEMGVTPEFPPAVVADAEASARSPRLPSHDRTDLPFVTIDPVGSMDLDQAMHLERSKDGYVVHYAIADVLSFVAPGGALEQETFKRGETLYGADSNVPLHPTVLSEGAASLLPDAERPALLWTIGLDQSGQTTDVYVERAAVRSRARLDYAGVQRHVDAGTVASLAPGSGLELLREIGELRIGLEAKRGGVSLPLPEQTVELAADGSWQLGYRGPVPAELWNAQISLLTGMAAASLMVEHRIGILRTLPAAEERDLRKLRCIARMLQVPWPDDMSYPDFIRSVDPTTPRGIALLTASTRTLRGAAYVAFDGELPGHVDHAAIAAPYAHVTAPLRRLADRYATEVCVALCAGTPVPDHVRAGLGTLPDVMRDSGRRAGQYERSVIDLVEAAVLSSRIGETFDAAVVEVDDKVPTRGKIAIQWPAVEAPATGARRLPLGESVVATLTAADPRTRSVAFEV